MAMLRNKYSQLLAAGLNKIFVEFEKTEMKSGYVDKVFNVNTSKSAYEDSIIFSGLGPMPEKTENASFQYQEMTQGGVKRIIHLTYGLGARYSWELAEDDQYGVIKKIPQALVRAGKFTREQVPFNVFNLGFTTYVTADGVALFSNVHPLLGGPAATNVGPGVTNVIGAAGTYPNRPATDVDLSFTAVQLMINQFERLIDSTGIPITYKPTQIIIPPELKFIAKEIFDSELQPYTSDNTLNAIKAEGLSYMTVPYLTSQSAWFALCEKAQHSLVFYNRSPLAQDFDDDFDTRSLKHVALQRFSAGAENWLGIWGSNGP